MEILVLNEDEVRQLLDPRALLQALADGFRALTAGEVTAPDRNEVGLQGAFLLGMPGRRDSTMAVKVVTVFESNRELPSHLATIGLYDTETGACTAFIDGTYITALRTSAAAALATDVLARRDARTLAIIGAGVQGEHHLRTFPLVRQFDDIRIASLYPEDAERLAACHPAARATTAEEAARGADVVALATHAATPVIEAAWVAPGTHVSSVGYRAISPAACSSRPAWPSSRRRSGAPSSPASIPRRRPSSARSCSASAAAAATPMRSRSTRRWAT
jgi:ornithine cyclodeaminase/alanine dehydrogenase-like protein (mu-crystallin family)